MGNYNAALWSRWQQWSPDHVMVFDLIEWVTEGQKKSLSLPPANALTIPEPMLKKWKSAITKQNAMVAEIQLL